MKLHLTEPPFTNQYNQHFEKGTYHCKRCDAPLFYSGSKFKSGCGCLSFDQKIKGAVKIQPDSDGQRTEIICTNCWAHLGETWRDTWKVYIQKKNTSQANTKLGLGDLA